MRDLAAILPSLGIPTPPHPDGRVRISGRDPVLAARLPIGEAAAAALALGGAAAAELHHLRGAPAAEVRVDVGHAAATLLGFVLQARADGTPSDDLVRGFTASTQLFATADDRFIHLHGGFPALHAGLLSFLDCDDDRASIASAVAGWRAYELEEALAETGLCGAVVRAPEEWDAQPQGEMLRTQPVVRIERIGEAPAEAVGNGPRPLSGVRVLDATRVLAGPTSGRTLAQYGADVLRVGAEKLPSIAAFFAETSHGKRSTFLDLDRSEDRRRLEALIDGSDVFTDGYRVGALAARGFSAENLAARRPGIIHVSISCYGSHGPLAKRRGWEQLAQSATGIAWIEGGEGSPKLLPAAATDYTTGYLAAYGAMEALRRRAIEGGSWRVEVSLCRTAMWLRELDGNIDPERAGGLPPLDEIRVTSPGPDGDLIHVAPAVSLSTTKVAWQRPTARLGGDAPEWLPRIGAPRSPSV